MSNTEINPTELTPKRFGPMALAFLVGVGVAAIAFYTVPSDRAPKTVPAVAETKIKKEFPNTNFVDFNQTEYGLIEAVTGENVFYFDQDVKVAIVGELLDIDKKVAVTVERRRQLSKFSDLDKTARADRAEPTPERVAAARAPAQAGPAPAQIVDVSALSEANYIVHNKGAGEILYVVSDFNCGFCNKLHNELKGVTDIEIREIPVRFMRDDSAIFGAHALCAEDQVSAAADIFAGKRTGITTCDEGVEAVEFNTEWAGQNGLTGTPALIKENGESSGGYRELGRIRAFLNS